MAKSSHHFGTGVLDSESGSVLIARRVPVFEENDKLLTFFVLREDEYVQW